MSNLVRLAAAFIAAALGARGAAACPLDQYDVGKLEQQLQNSGQNSQDLGNTNSARNQLNAGNPSGAAPLLQNASNSHDPFVAAAGLNEMSRMYLMQNQPGMALNAAQQSASLNPSYGEAYANVSAAKMAMGDQDGARQFAARALEVWPDHAPIQKLAQVMNVLPEGALAGRASASAAAANTWLNPGSLPGGLGGGKSPTAMLGAGANDAPARLRASEASETLGANGPAADAKSLLQIGDVKAAVDNAKLRLLSNPNDGDAHAILAKASNIEGDYAKAIDEATKALEAGNHNVDALNARAFAQNNLGHPKSALMDADTAVALSPADALARLNRAQALETLGEKEKAMKDYKRAARLNPAFKKAFEQAYARNFPGRPGDLNSGLDGLTSSPVRVGAGLVLSLGAFAGFLALRPKPVKPRGVTTGVLKALGNRTTGGRS
jgi:tetratricopeptide (TPR) repeat protein